MPSLPPSDGVAPTRLHQRHWHNHHGCWLASWHQRPQQYCPTQDPIARQLCHGLLQRYHCPAPALHHLLGGARHLRQALDHRWSIPLAAQ
jgi:hypothetical protein